MDELPGLQCIGKAWRWLADLRCRSVAELRSYAEHGNDGHVPKT
jgi:hypothetical protein